MITYVNHYAKSKLDENEKLLESFESENSIIVFNSDEMTAESKFIENFKHRTHGKFVEVKELCNREFWKRNLNTKHHYFLFFREHSDYALFALAILEYYKLSHTWLQKELMHASELYITEMWGIHSDTYLARDTRTKLVLTPSQVNSGIILISKQFYFKNWYIFNQLNMNTRVKLVIKDSSENNGEKVSLRVLITLVMNLLKVIFKVKVIDIARIFEKISFLKWNSLSLEVRQILLQGVNSVEGLNTLRDYYSKVSFYKLERLSLFSHDNHFMGILKGEGDELQKHSFSILPHKVACSCITYREAIPCAAIVLFLLKFRQYPRLQFAMKKEQIIEILNRVGVIPSLYYHGLVIFSREYQIDRERKDAQKLKELVGNSSINDKKKSSYRVGFEKHLELSKEGRTVASLMLSIYMYFKLHTRFREQGKLSKFDNYLEVLLEVLTIVDDRRLEKETILRALKQDESLPEKLRADFKELVKIALYFTFRYGHRTSRSKLWKIYRKL